MKEVLKKHKKTILTIIVVLLVVGLIIGCVFGVKKSHNDKAEENNIEEKSSVETEDLNINDGTGDNKETPKKELETLADYEGYWFNINDLRDYIAIHDIKDTSLTFDLFLYRLYSMEKIKVTLDCENTSKFKYKDNEISIEGTIKINNQEVNLSISKSNFEYIKKGTTYQFNVQMKKKAFEEHMMKIAEAENNN